jgi:hypothetical protein
MTAIDTLAMKARLLEDLERSVGMRVGMDSYVQSVSGTIPEQKIRKKPIAKPIPAPQTLPEGIRTGDKYREAMSVWLRNSENFYVNREMIDVAVAAASVLPEETTIERHDPPSDFGWLWLEAPISVMDVRSHVLRLTACVWAVFNGQLHTAWMTNKNDRLDSTNVSIKAWESNLIPLLTANSLGRIRFGSTFPRQYQFSYEGGGIIPVDKAILMKRNEEGEYIAAKVEGTEDDAQLAMSDCLAPDFAFLFTIWRLMRQERWAHVERENKFPKGLSRMLRKIDLIDQTVSVIIYRRIKSKGTGDTLIEWNFRWLRRGFWRKQWYGSGDNKYQADIFIHPTICGPEDKPIRITEHVNALVR